MDRQKGERGWLRKKFLSVMITIMINGRITGEELEGILSLPRELLQRVHDLLHLIAGAKLQGPDEK